MLNKTGSVLFAFIVLLAVATAASAGLPAPPPPPTYEVIALTGQHAPGMPDFTTFSGMFTQLVNGSSSFNNVVSNAAGDIAFRATLGGPGVTTASDQGIWLARDGALSLVLREGSQVPGLNSGVAFSGFGLPFPSLDVTPGGDVYVGATFSGPGVTSSNDWGMFVYRNGGTSLLFREGASAPVGQSLDGGLAFSDTVGSIQRIWSNRGGALATVARTGDAVPTFPAGTTFTDLSVRAFNSNGQVAFLATLAGPGVSEANNSSLWMTDSNGALTLVAREGTSAPGASTSTMYGTNFEQVVLNDAGHIAFVNAIDGSRRGAWSGLPNKISAVVLPDDEAPGLPAGTYFDTVTQSDSQSLHLDEDGEVYFVASLGGPGANGSTLWSSRTATLLAGRSDHAPDTPPLVTFLSGGPGTQLFSVSRVGPPYVSGLTNVGRGLWRIDDDDELRLVVRAGDTIEVGPDDHRVVESIQNVNLAGPLRGRDGLNRVAFAAQFYDGTTGVIRAVPAIIPEPTSWSLAFIGLGSIMAMVNRKQRW